MCTHARPHVRTRDADHSPGVDVHPELRYTINMQNTDTTSRHTALSLEDALLVADPETTYQLSVAAGDGEPGRHAA